MKNVLILGGGGREHAIAEKLRKSDKVGKIFCLPGNAGISEIAECKDISPMDFDAVYDFIEGCDFKATPVDMVVVASDDPLAKGMVDFLTEKGIRAFGPTKKAAELEWSKSYAKDFMYRHGIPTAKSASFDTYKEALAYVERQEYPCVIKADGLALGKGVIICNDFDEAKKALSDIMLDKYFGESGSRVVVEEFMKGKEVSVLAFTDGKTIVPMVSAQDHKKIYDGDEGPNTGGMGAFSPSAAYTDEVRADFEKNVMYPTLRGLIEDGIEYKEVIARGALDSCDMSDFIFNRNHGQNDSTVYARTRNNSLTYNITERGLDIAAFLDKEDERHRNLHRDIQKRRVDKMSFSFVVRECSYDRETHTRTITKIKKLYDVSAVDFAAYNETSITTARDFFSAEHEKEFKEQEQRRRRQMLTAKTYC